MKKLLLTLALLISVVSFGQTVQEYLQSGDAKAFAKDYKGAINDYTEAIFLDRNNFEAYQQRGFVKTQLDDYRGGILDFTYAIKLDPINSIYSYVYRALAKVDLNNHKGAILDFSLAIELIPTFELYFDIAKSKANLGDHKGAISDYTKALEQKRKSSLLLYGNINDYQISYIYYNRAISKFYINDLTGACEDANKTEELGQPFADMIKAACN
jgi:tetratricopeptide (TPR) repeat protein